MWWTWILASATAAGSAGAVPPEPVEQPWGSRPATSFIDGDTVHLYGVLYDDMLQPLRELLARAPVPPRRLQVASRGGDAMAGLAVGELVRRYGLEVVVAPPGCGSACAAYVFTAATRKVISPGAVVVWHNSCPNRTMEQPQAMEKYLRTQLGTAFELRYVVDGVAIEDPGQLQALLEREIDDWVAQTVDYARKWRLEHERFFAGTPVDARGVCLEDHLDLPDVPADSFSYSYTLSVADMERLGICNVHAPEDYTGQATRFFAHRGRDVDAGVISLADHPRFVPLHAPGGCAKVAGEPAPQQRADATDTVP